MAQFVNRGYFNRRYVSRQFFPRRFVNPNVFPSATGVVFGGVVQSFSHAVNQGTGAQVIVTLTGAVPAGATIIVRSCGRTSLNIIAVADSQSNPSWTVQFNRTVNTGFTLGMATCLLTTGLGIGDTITISYAVGTGFVAAGDISYVTGSSSVDNVANGGVASGTSMTQSNTTTATNEVIVGIAGSDVGTSASSGTWITDGSGAGSFTFFLLVHTDAPTTTTYNNLISWTNSSHAGWIAISFK